MRIKCTSIENKEEVMKFLEEKLKARINELEIKINDKCFIHDNITHTPSGC